MFDILIVDDHAIVREGIKHTLSSVENIANLEEAATAAEGVRKAKEKAWGVIILDLSLPDRSGIDVLKELKQCLPNVPVLVLTMHSEEQYGLRTYQAGASGFLTKDSSPEQLATAVKKIAAGGRYVSPSLAEKLVAFLEEDEEKVLPHERLSDREFEVFSYIARGEALSEIAQKLNLSVKTISTYRARLLYKMKLSNNYELICYASENRLA